MSWSPLSRNPHADRTWSDAQWPVHTRGPSSSSDVGLVTRMCETAIEVDVRVVGAVARCRRSHCPTVTKEVVSGTISMHRDSWASKPRLAVVEVVVSPEPGPLRRLVTLEVFQRTHTCWVELRCLGRRSCWTTPLWRSRACTNRGVVWRCVARPHVHVGMVISQHTAGIRQSSGSTQTPWNTRHVSGTSYSVTKETRVSLSLTSRSSTSNVYVSSVGASNQATGVLSCHASNYWNCHSLSGQCFFAHLDIGASRHWQIKVKLVQMNRGTWWSWVRRGLTQDPSCGAGRPKLFTTREGHTTLLLRNANLRPIQKKKTTFPVDDDRASVVVLSFRESREMMGHRKRKETMEEK